MYYIKFCNYILLFFARQKNVIRKGNVTFIDGRVFVCLGPFVFCNYQTLVTLLILSGRSFSPIDFVFFKGILKSFYSIDLDIDV